MNVSPTIERIAADSKSNEEIWVQDLQCKPSDHTAYTQFKTTLTACCTQASGARRYFHHRASVPRGSRPAV